MGNIAVFDIDGTLYNGTLTISVVEELVKSLDLVKENSRLREGEKVWKERNSTESYWAYNKVALKVFEEIIPKLTPTELQSAVKIVLEKEGTFRYAYTAQLVHTLKSEGYILIAMSGSIKDIIEPYAQALGFDIIVASELEVIDGIYTGKRVSDTVTGKDKVLAEIVSQRGLTLKGSIGVGDTHRDISMLAMVEHPIAFNPNAALYKQACRRGWKIVIERKNMVYELTSKSGSYVIENIHPTHNDSNQELFQ